MVGAAVALLASFYLLVGRALLGEIQGGSRPSVPAVLATGFAVSPVLLAWLALATGGRIVTAAAVLLALALLALCSRRWRAARPTEAFCLQAARPAGVPLLVGVAIALAVDSPYLAWVLGWCPTPRACVLGTSVFDFEKHVGMTSALAAYGFPAQHPAAPGVPLLYYLGFYMVPAALSSVWPAATIDALVAQFLIAAVVLTCFFVMSTHAVGASGAGGVLATVLVVSCGLSLGANLPALAAGNPAATTWPFWHPPLHIEPVAWMLVWVPQHAVATSCAVFVLATWETLARGTWRDGLLAAALCASVLAFSAFVGLLLGLTLAAVIASSQRRPTPHEAADRGRAPTGVPWPRALGAALTAGVLALPFYLPTAAAWLSGHVPSGSVFQLTESLPFNAGTIVAACGFGLVGLALFPLVSRTPLAPGLRPVWLLLCVSLLIAVFASRVSELQFMALYVLQLGLPFLTCQVVMCTGQRRATAGILARAALVCLAAVSGAYGLSQVRSTWLSTPRSSLGDIELVQWIRQHSPSNAIVSTLGFDRTSFDYRTGRAGAASGVGIFSRLEDRWAPADRLQAYREANAPRLGALSQTDYLLVPKRAMRYFSEVEDPPAPHAVSILQAMGFRVAIENGAGWILRNERSAPLRPLSVVELEGPAAVIAYARGLILERNDPDRATQVLEPWAAAPDAPAEAAYLLAFSLQASDRDPVRALGLYERVLRAGHEEFWVRYNRGALYTKLGDRTAACADLRRARELDATHDGAATLLRRLGECRGETH